MTMTMIMDMIPCIMAFFSFAFFLAALLASLARDTYLPCFAGF